MYMYILYEEDQSAYVRAPTRLAVWGDPHTLTTCSCRLTSYKMYFSNPQMYTIYFSKLENLFLGTNLCGSYQQQQLEAHQLQLPASLAPC